MIRIPFRNFLRLFSTLVAPCVLLVSNTYGQQWNALPEELNQVGKDINEATAYSDLLIDTTGENLFLGGSFYERISGPDSLSNIISWDGNDIKHVGGGLYGIGIFKLLYFSGKLYAMGAHGFGPPVVGLIGSYNGTGIWEQVPSSCPILTGGKVWDGYVFNEELFIGHDGVLDTILDTLTNWPIPLPYISRLNSLSDSCWEYPGAGIYGGVFQFETYQNNLIVGGWFDSVGTSVLGQHLAVKNIVGWDGQNWIDLATNSVPYPVRKMCVHNDTLYVSGSAGQIHYLDGNQWKLFARLYRNDAIDKNGIVGVMTSLDNRLYVGGSFNKIDSLFFKNITYFENGQWHAMENGIGNGFVNDIVKWKGDIYAAGGFEIELNGKTVYDIARWGEPVGVEEYDGTEKFIKLFPNPVSGILNIKLKGGFDNNGTTFNIKILNITGEHMLSVGFSGSFMNMDVSSLMPGIYFITITSDNQEGMFAEKFVIE